MLPLYITFKKRHKKRKFFSGFSLAPRRLPDRPRKASAWSGNQQTSLSEPRKKEKQV